MKRILSVFIVGLALSACGGSDPESLVKDIQVNQLGPAFGFSYTPDANLYFALEQRVSLGALNQEYYSTQEVRYNETDDPSKIRPYISASSWFTTSVITNDDYALSKYLPTSTTIEFWAAKREEPLSLYTSVTLTDFSDAQLSANGPRSLFVKGRFSAKSWYASASAPRTVRFDGDIYCGSKVIYSRQMPLTLTDQGEWTDSNMDMVIPNFDFASCRDTLRVAFYLTGDIIRFSGLDWGLSKVIE